MVPYDKTKTKITIMKEEQIKLEIQDNNIIFPASTKINMLYQYKNSLVLHKIKIKKIKLENFDIGDKLTILKKCSTNSTTITNVLANIIYVVSLEKVNEYHLIGYPKLSQITIQKK